MKNKKKIVSNFVVLSILTSCFVGCSTNERKDIRNVQDGTFTASSDGYLGDITVEVTFRDGILTDAEVIEHMESAAISEDAIKNIPEYVVENQSVSVDVSTGATITSKGILNAISDAIEQAGGNLSEWQEDATLKHETKIEELETDVIVIGAGTSGIATVLRLEELGYDTVLIEKTDTLGGSISFQKDPSQIVISDDSESKSLLKQDLLSGSEGANETLVKLLTDQLEETVIWQKEILGLDFEKEYIDTGDYQENALKYFDLSSGDISELYEKEAEVSGSKILKETGIIGLIQNGQGIDGIKAKSANGTVYEISSEALVFATGSGSHVSDTLMYGPEGNTGDAVFIVSGAGISFYPTTYTYSSYPAIQIDESGQDVYHAVQKALRKGAFIMNENYERFVREDESQENLYKAALNQEKTYIVMSESAYKSFLNEIDDEDGSLQEALEENYGGSTLMDVCSKENLDAFELIGLVNKYNHMVSSKADTDFGRSEESLKNTIESNEKCYIIPLYNYCFDTNDGFEVNEKLQVQTIDGETMDSVYAVGSVAGNVFGSTMLAGAGNAWAFVSGKYVADEIAQSLDVLQSK